ncbi:hypothetical protein ACLB2K_059609 [Fragaria x ananassa]
MVLTAHFIDDDWVLHKRILNFVVIPNHKGKTIRQLVESCLIGWGIEKVFTIVVDNASPNKVGLDYMRDKIGNWKELVLNGAFLHMRCCCHILNLIVKDGMEELGSLIDAIGEVELYFMLDIAVKYRKAFMRLEDEDIQFESYFQEKIGGKKMCGPPNSADWDKVVRLVKFLLKIFHDATIQNSGSKVVTDQPLLWMCTIVGELDKCIKSGDPLMASIGIAMKEKFDKYWGRLEDMNKICLIVVLMDPRYKVLYLEYFFPKLQEYKAKVQQMVTEVKKIFEKMYKEYYDADPEAAQASMEAILPKVDGAPALSVDEDSHAANISAFMKLREEQHVVEIKSEVDKYLLEALEDPTKKNFGILGWWKENAPRYPILSQIAKDVFPVPASTVASKSAFSLGKRVIDPFRASLTPRMVECLVYCSDWLRGNSSAALYK